MLVFGFFLLILRNIIPDFLSVFIANILIYSSYLLQFEGVRWFRGKTGFLWTSYASLTAFTLLFAYYSLIFDNLQMRMYVVSIFYALFSFQTAYELVNNATGIMKRAHWFTGSLFLIHGFSMVVRLLIVLLSPPMTDLFAPNLGLSIVTFLIPIPVHIAWSFGLIQLNSERLELELNSAREELVLLAMRDSLTGAYNNRYFFEIGKNEVHMAQRYNYPISVIMYDIDYFKQINDTYGHPTGDQVLKSLVDTSRKCLRDADILGRLGGDEFALILLQTDQQKAMLVAERLRQLVEAVILPTEDGIVKYTISMGVSEVCINEDGVEHAIKRADKALYEAKRNDKNLVAVADEDRETSSIPFK